MYKKLVTTEQAKKAKNNVQAPATGAGTSKLPAKDQLPPGKDKGTENKDITDDKELSSEEKLAFKEIKPIEKKALDKAFRRLCRATSAKDYADQLTPEEKREEEERRETEKKKGNVEDDSVKKFFTATDIAKVLAELNHAASKPEIDLMVWEVDENLDKRVDRYEFDLMFKRCIYDTTGLEPKSLFNLVQFLMYAKEDAIEITEEDTLELIYVRKGSIQGLEEALQVIFGKEERRVDGIEKKVSFTEFLERRNNQALEQRRKEKQAKKDAKSTLKKEEK